MSVSKVTNPLVEQAIAESKVRKDNAKVAILKADFVPLATDFAKSLSLDVKVTTEFIGLAEGILAVHKSLGEKYLGICTFIRDKQIAPKAVSVMLKDMGFRKERIYEINKVSQCSDEMWSRFQAKDLGFRKVLELSQGSVAHDALGLSKEEREDAIEVGEVGSGKKKKATAKERLALASKKVLLAVAELKNPQLPIRIAIGNGWGLTIAKVGEGEVQNTLVNPAK